MYRILESKLEAWPGVLIPTQQIKRNEGNGSHRVAGMYVETNEQVSHVRSSRHRMSASFIQYLWIVMAVAKRDGVGGGLSGP